MKPKSILMQIIRTGSADGFTLIELIISLVVTSLLGLAMMSSYVAQQRASTSIRQVTQMQQQLRGAMYIMEEDLRVAGYNPEQADGFGVINVQRHDITDEVTASAPNAGGSPSLTILSDWDPLNPASTNGLPDDPQISYRLFDENNDGLFELTRDDGTMPRPLLADNIEAIGYAYAYDNDEDGELDRDANGNIIWAVDTDNDNRLDTCLDTDGNGNIDLNDDSDNNFRILPNDGLNAALAGPVPVDRIRMVRIWLLARARNASRDFNSNGQQFLVGDQVVPANAAGFTDNIRRSLLTRTVMCRNTGY